MVRLRHECDLAAGEDASRAARLRVGECRRCGVSRHCWKAAGADVAFAAGDEHINHRGELCGGLVVVAGEGFFEPVGTGFFEGSSHFQAGIEAPDLLPDALRDVGRAVEHDGEVRSDGGPDFGAGVGVVEGVGPPGADLHSFVAGLSADGGPAPPVRDK